MKSLAPSLLMGEISDNSRQYHSSFMLQSICQNLFIFVASKAHKRVMVKEKSH